MPLQNNNFQWRPNDRSGLTLLRYRLESQRWYDSLMNINRENTRRIGSMASSFDFVSSILGLIFCVILLILLGILSLVKLALGTNRHPHRGIPITRKDYSDRLLRMPVRKDYPTEEEYYDVLGAYIMSQKV